MSEASLISLLVFIAFSCALLVAEWAAGRVAQSQRDRREPGLKGKKSDQQHRQE